MTHDLLQIALQLGRSWSDADKELFADLTEYAVAARCDGTFWAERKATAGNTGRWIGLADNLSVI